MTGTSWGSPHTADPTPIIRCDNWTELTSRHFDAWAYMRVIEIDHIRPGKPVENVYIEWFNGRLGDDCLNAHWFDSIEEAGVGLDAWRRDYNDVRCSRRSETDPADPASPRTLHELQLLRRELVTLPGRGRRGGSGVDQCLGVAWIRIRASPT